MDNLEILSETIEEADSAAGAAATAVGVAQADHEKIQGRIAALTAERAGIVARRTAGDQRADDGPALALIGADIEGLQGLLPGAEAALADAKARKRHADAAVAGARGAYAAAEARRKLAALDAHAAELLRLLAETIGQRRTAAAALSPDQRNLAAIVARGGALQNLLLGEIAAARSSPPSTPYGSRPLWPVREDLSNELHRIRHTDGRMS